MYTSPHISLPRTAFSTALFHLLHGLREAELGNDGHRHSRGFHGLNNFIGLRHGESHGFLDDDVFTGPGRLNGLWGVKTYRSADANHIDRGIGQELFHGIESPNTVVFGKRLSGLLDHVCSADQAGTIDFPQSRGMEIGNHAAPDDAEP